MERTCLVTKMKADPTDLLRFVIRDGQLVFDESTKAPGRGGYVVKSTEAVDKLPKLSGKIAHFLKVKKVEVRGEELEKAKNLIV